MATTYELIDSVVLGSDTATVTFSSIPATFDDLLLVCSSRQSDSAAEAYSFLTFNSDTGSNYSTRALMGSGASASSFAATQNGVALRTVANTATASTFGNTEVYIPNYAGSTNKSLSSTSVSETNSSTAYINAHASIWSDTSAITSISLAPAAGGAIVFKSGSSFYLYGITKA